MPTATDLIMLVARLFILLLTVFTICPRLVIAQETPGSSSSVVQNAESVSFHQQIGQEPQTHKLSSPREVMRVFLSSMNKVDDGYDNAWPSVLNCFDFPPDLTDAERQDIARTLLDVLNRLGRVDLQQLPGELAVNTDMGTDTRPIRRYQFFPSPVYAWVWDKLANHGIAPKGRIVIERGDDDVWRFSRQTVLDIPILDQSTELLPPSYFDQAAKT
ncbi:MAG: hypothetical protein D6698_13610, partial [Gammaproteobacteria bacterium]